MRNEAKKVSEINFSIIVPFKNTQKYLPFCLDSLLAQDFPSGGREILCVNDGSTDGSVAIVKSYESKDSGIKLLFSPGCGPGMARNIALAQAQGGYILFVDSDDSLPEAGTLKYLASKMEEGRLDLLNFGARVQFADEELKRSRYREEQRYKERQSAGIFPTGRELLHELVKREAFLGSACLLCLRRSYVEKQGLRFPALFHSEDEVFCLRAFLGAGRSEHTGRRLYLRSVRQDSLTTRPDNIEAFRERMKAVVLLQETVDRVEEAPWLGDYLARFMQDVCRRFVSLPREEQAGAEKFSPWEAAFFRMMKFCAHIHARAHSSYLFPWHLFRRGERVAIYGAGNVGRDFVRQMQEFGYVELAGVVDRDGPRAKLPGTEVIYPADLKNLDYDAILLSVQDRTLADSIREDLKKLGISEAKIRWDGAHYLQKDFYEGYYFPKLSERKNTVEV